jgi:chemotaxis protein methyltransferase WspC
MAGIAPRATPAPRTPAAPPRLAPAAPGGLAAARQLADGGRLDEARAACEALLRARPADAGALALLGAVHLAAGRTDDALTALRKALYLAPDHVEALEQMSALCARRGDVAGAAALRQRLARIAGPAGEDDP